MIMEIKWNKSAKVALDQIKNRKYYQQIKQYDEVLLVGINYDSINKTHECIFEIKKLEK